MATTRVVGASASVVLICGLPGSGKSTLASSMASRLAEQQRGHDDSSDEQRQLYSHVVLIDYDDIANRIAVSEQLAVDSSVPTADDEASNSNTAFDDTDLLAWRESRKMALTKLEDELTSFFEAQSESNISNQSNNLLVILDDNFHLRSMRRDVYKVCQKVVASSTEEKNESDAGRNARRIGFSLVLVDTPLEICLQRNATRQGKACVPEGTIRNMAASFERPETDTKDYMKKFELNSIAVDASQKTSTDDVYDANEERICSCLRQSLDNPVVPPQKEVGIDPEVLQKQREQTLSNLIHRADRLLRTMVGAVGRADKTMGRTANEARKCILQRVRDDNVLSGDSDDGMYEAVIVEQFKTYLVENGGDKVRADSELLSVIDIAYQGLK